MGKTTTKEVNIPSISIFVLFLCLLSKCCHYHVKNYIFALSERFISTMTILEMNKCHYINNPQLRGWQSRLLPEKFIVNRGERVVEQIVTPRNALSTKAQPRLTMTFLGVTICSTTLSAMCYLLYYTECSFLLVSFFFMILMP